MLSNIVADYNSIHVNVEQHEFGMIAHQIQAIDIELVLLFEQYTWLDYGKSIRVWRITAVRSNIAPAVSSTTTTTIATDGQECVMWTTTIFSSPPKRHHASKQFVPWFTAESFSLLNFSWFSMVFFWRIYFLSFLLRISFAYPYHFLPIYAFFSFLSFFIYCFRKRRVSWIGRLKSQSHFYSPRAFRFRPRKNSLDYCNCAHFPSLLSLPSLFHAYSLGCCRLRNIFAQMPITSKHCV